MAMNPTPGNKPASGKPLSAPAKPMHPQGPAKPGAKPNK